MGDKHIGRLNESQKARKKLSTKLLYNTGNFCVKMFLTNDEKKNKHETYWNKILSKRINIAYYTKLKKLKM